MAGGKGAPSAGSVEASEVTGEGRILECKIGRKADEEATAIPKAGSAMGGGSKKPSVPNNLLSDREIRRILARKPRVAPSKYVALKERNPDLTPSPEEEMDKSKRDLYFLAKLFFKLEENYPKLQKWVRQELETKGFVELDDCSARCRAETRAAVEEKWKKIEVICESIAMYDDEDEMDYDDEDDELDKVCAS